MIKRYDPKVHNIDLTNSKVSKCARVVWQMQRQKGYDSKMCGDYKIQIWLMNGVRCLAFGFDLGVDHVGLV